MASSIPPLAVPVVENEPLIRMAAVNYLEDAGLRTVEAADADEALKLLEREDVGILFTDMDIPGSMDALELANLVRERWETMCIVVVSGCRRARTKDLPSNSFFARNSVTSARLLQPLPRCRRRST